MRMQKLTIPVVLATLGAGLTACNSDSLTTMNNNPNAPTQVEPQLLFTNGAVAAPLNLRGLSFEHGLEALWVQHYAEVQYPEADLYNPRGATVDGLWSTLYAGALQDLKQVITQAASKKNVAGPAMIMRAWTFQAMTDVWGDIPFSAANQGQTGSITPTYDTQKAIYDSLLVELKVAGEQMDAGAATLGSADPIFGGSPALWRKFANSLRARIAMRMSKVDPSRAALEVKDALSAPVMTSNADNAMLVYPGDGVSDNPLNTNWKTRDDQRLSKTFIDTLTSLADPRVAKYAAPTDSSKKCAGCYSTYVGAQNGLTASPNAIPLTSRPSLAIRSPQSPSYLMTAAEVLFIQAEAAQRGWVTGNAAALYNAAITESMKQWGVDDAAIATYLAQPRVAYNAATGLEQIALQKWIALFNQETEAYAEWRRTGIPTLTPGPETAIKTVPRRFPYPTTEESFNGPNRAAAVANQGGATLTDRVWWDK
jgi:SusD/RagB-like outer membrane lipoprotein